MRGVKVTLLLAVVALLGAGFSACAGDGSEDSDQSGAFRVQGGDNSIQDYGEEADRSELAAAEAVLAGYLAARAADDWEKQCRYLAKATLKPLEQLAANSPQLQGKGCAALLEELSDGIPASTRTDPMSAGLGSLRSEDDRAFALFHGSKGVDYFIPMSKEGEDWKVAALAPSEFP